MPPKYKRQPKAVTELIQLLGRCARDGEKPGPTQIAQIVGCSKGTISHIWKNRSVPMPGVASNIAVEQQFKRCSKWAKFKDACAKKALVVQTKQIRGKVYKYRPYSTSVLILAALPKALRCYSTSSVKRALREMGFSFKKRRRGIQFSIGDALKRVAFGQRIGSDPLLTAENVLLADEHWTCDPVWGGDGEWVPPGEKATRCPNDAGPFSAHRHIFVCIGWNFRFIAVLPPKRLNWQEYQRYCLQPMFSKLKEEGHDCSSYYYAHDLASYHTATKIRSYLASKVKHVLEHPARGCDGNPVEQCWLPIERAAQELGYENSMSREDATPLLRRALYERVPQEFTNALVSSYRQRWANIVEARGEQLDDVGTS